METQPLYQISLMVINIFKKDLPTGCKYESGYFINLSLQLLFNINSNESMSILDGIRPNTGKPEKYRFVIKSCLATRQNNLQCQTDSTNSSNNEYMINKSMRLRELIDKRHIRNEDQFFEKHLYNSICLKTILKTILQRMMNDRRIGKKLKGMNKSNFQQIEQSIWEVVQREGSLCESEANYIRQKNEFKKQLQKGKEELIREIEKISQFNIKKDVSRTSVQLQFSNIEQQ